jgi:cytochrome c oxidase subunit 4
MSATSVEDIRKHLKVYYMVFGALAVLTVVTVAVAEMHFLTVPQAIAVALCVAIVKGSLVACYFMHLISERGMVFWILGLCAFFFIVILFIPVVEIGESVGIHH